MSTVQDSFGKVQDFVRRVQEDYVGWIVKNPSRATDTESALKILSYLLHGRLKKSAVILPELIYCGANVLSFWHDRVIQQHLEAREKGREEIELASLGSCSSKKVPSVPTDGPSLSAELASYERQRRESRIQKIKTALTIIDYLEVFLEVSARHMWGDVGRWIIIILIQSVKTGLRAALLFHYKIGLIGSSTLYQRNFNRRGAAQWKGDVTFVLKHSGRSVRKVYSAPPVRSRDWTHPVSYSNASHGTHELSPSRLTAEVIHLMRPMAHLATLFAFGSKSWKPWLLSFGMDVVSLKLHSDAGNLRKEDKLELLRRTYALCYYLMRSPFYDKFTKQRLMGILSVFSDKIPLVGTVFGVLAQAIPEWQNTYSYMWTDY